MAAVLVLGGLVWLASGFLGGGQEYTVLAHTWEGEQQRDTAMSMGGALQAQLEAGTFIQLRELPAGEDVKFALFVGKAGSVEGLKPTLEFVQSATLPELAVGDRPFASATIQPYTQPD